MAGATRGQRKPEASRLFLNRWVMIHHWLPRNSPSSNQALGVITLENVDWIALSMLIETGLYLGIVGFAGGVVGDCI